MDKRRLRLAAITVREKRFDTNGTIRSIADKRGNLSDSPVPINMIHLPCFINILVDKRLGLVKAEVTDMYGVYATAETSCGWKMVSSSVRVVRI
jgi:hypothetical protein